MSDSTVESIFVGNWTYRSFKNVRTFEDPDNPAECVPDPDHPGTCSSNLVFGAGTIRIVEAAPGLLRGSIGGAGWSLELHGSRSYGNPMEVRFQGTGNVGGHPWAYSYVGYLVPEWPNGVHQAPAMVGSIVRDIDHPGSGGIHKAGEVASWYAVRQT